MREFLLGLLAMTSLTAALIFFSYRQVGHERLLLFFALAFIALAVNWVAVGMVGPGYEYPHVEYLARMLTFALIVIAIIDNNHRGRRQ